MNAFLKYLTICLFMGSLVLQSAQGRELEKSDSLMFTGQVFDSETKRALEHAAYDIGHTMYISDEKGRFRFTAHEGDTIVFHHVGYKPLYLLVDDSLSNEEYLTGVFLSPDLVQLSEVIVVPRQYDLETLVKTTPMDYTELQVAEKNMKMSAYQGLMSNNKWDAETNQKYALKKEQMRVEYKGMVQPDQMFAANLTTVVPEAKLTYGPNPEPQIDMGAINTQEENYLLTVFDAIKQERARRNPDAYQQKPPLKPINK